jgi:hypothetical protein
VLLSVHLSLVVAREEKVPIEGDPTVGHADSTVDRGQQKGKKGQRLTQQQPMQDVLVDEERHQAQDVHRLWSGQKWQSQQRAPLQVEHLVKLNEGVACIAEHQQGFQRYLKQNTTRFTRLLQMSVHRKIDCGACSEKLIKFQMEILPRAE